MQLQDLPPCVPIRYPARAFDVYIVVDTREVKFKKDRTYIQEQLELQGVRTITRSLTVGDFIWIAKPRDGSAREGKEIVLDHVIERKTTDDLVASIKDSRYKDQKIRLMTCGIRNKIYLVEKSPSLARAIDFGMTAIRTAMTQVQVIEGFFLKQTASLNETLQYLVRMTRQLSILYSGQDLFAIPPEIISKDTFKEQREALERQHRCRLHVVYDTYQSLNNKSKDYKLQEIWTRQLMSIKGVSGEKAAALAKTFPTMRSLISALENCPNDSSREALIRGGGGAGRKAIGGALAKKIQEVIWPLAYE
ncbi:restriction endonuclease type II-like protein [Powellomyces hirtus]|nr:restriction endonuclease type II-like protein [Powellomyces hirtus]